MMMAYRLSFFRGIDMTSHGIIMLVVRVNNQTRWYIFTAITRDNVSIDCGRVLSTVEPGHYESGNETLEVTADEEDIGLIMYRSNLYYQYAYNEDLLTPSTYHEANVGVIHAGRFPSR